MAINAHFLQSLKEHGSICRTKLEEYRLFFYPLFSLHTFAICNQALSFVLI